MNSSISDAIETMLKHSGLSTKEKAVLVTRIAGNQLLQGGHRSISFVSEKYFVELNITEKSDD